MRRGPERDPVVGDGRWPATGEERLLRLLPHLAKSELPVRPDGTGSSPDLTGPVRSSFFLPLLLAVPEGAQDRDRAAGRGQIGPQRKARIRF